EQVGLRIHSHVGWQIGLGRAVDASVGIIAVWALCAGLADLVDEGAVHLELQDVRVVAEVRRPSKLAVEVLRLPVSGDVDEVVVIDKDAVLTRGPDAPVFLAASLFQKAGITRTTPGLQQIPRFVELEHRRRGEAAAGKLPVRSWVSDRANRPAPCVLARFAKRPGIGRGERPGTVVNPNMIMPIDE